MKHAVVVTHYKLPPKRLHDFLRWNKDSLNAFDVGVVLVTDTPFTPQDDSVGAVNLVYPSPLQPFALSKTSNYGLRWACDHLDLDSVVIKSDIDCILTRALVGEMVTKVRQGFALAPKYYMAKDEHSIAGARMHPCLIGTLGMVAQDWELIRGYDERMVAYGWEDGDARDRALSLGIRVPRTVYPIYHMAHNPESNQMPGKRRDQWNRTTINPPNREENYALKGTWDIEPLSVHWGLAL